MHPKFYSCLIHIEYKISGINLKKDITISPAFAVVGGKYKIKLFEETIFVSLPKHLKDGEIIKVEKKGYISEDEIRGDLLLKVHIKMPDDISEREEKLYEQILKMERKKMASE